MKTTNLKYQSQQGTDNSNNLMDHSVYQVFKIILNIYQKSMGKRLLLLQ